MFFFTVGELKMHVPCFLTILQDFFQDPNVFPNLVVGSKSGPPSTLGKQTYMVLHVLVNIIKVHVVHNCRSVFFSFLFSIKI